MSILKASKNALMHGTYSSLVVMPWEDEQEFKALHEVIREELFPDGPCEEEVVFDLAVLEWRKRRLHVGSQLRFRKIPEAKALEVAASGNKGWEGIADHLGSHVRVAEEMRASLLEMAKSRTIVARRLLEIINEKVLAHFPELETIETSGGEPANSTGTGIGAARGCESTDATNAESIGTAAKGAAPKIEGDAGENEALENLDRMCKLLRWAGDQIIPALRAATDYDPDERVCDQAYAPEILERTLRIEAEIDRRKDKQLAQLVRLKEYKKFYLPKQLSAQVKTQPAKGQALELGSPKVSTPASVDVESPTSAPK